MSKLGYLFLAIIIAALAIFVFRPDHDEPSGVTLTSAPLPATFTVTIDGVEQRVENRVVRVKGLELPLSSDHASSLWNLLTSFSVSKDRVIDRVVASDLPAYGIDGRNRIDSEPLAAQFGKKDGKGYVYDGRKIFVVDEAVVDRMRALSARLDEERLISKQGEVTSLQIDEVLVEHAAKSSYVAPKEPQRPDFSRRVQSFLSLVNRVRLANLDGKLPADARLFGTAIMTITDPAGAASELKILLYQHGQAGSLVSGALPAQALDRLTFAQLADLFDSFKEDYLFNVDNDLRGNPVDRVQVEKDGSEWFALERRGKQDSVSGASQWDLLYQGGRQNAAAESVQRLAEAFNDLTVKDVRTLTAVDATLPAGAIRITVIGAIENGTAVLTLFGDQARSATHQGKIARVQPILKTIGPDAFLDPLLLDRQSSRVIKIQRRWRTGKEERGEVFVLGDNGSWRQSYPGAKIVDDPALVRLAGTVAHAKALNARFPTPDDERILTDADFEIDVRLAPKQSGHANDLTNIDETIALDVGWCCKKQGGMWKAVNKDATVAYDLDDDLMEVVLGSVEGRHMLPVVQSDVLSIEVERAGERYKLIRTRSGWSLKIGDGEPRVADAVAVRTYLNRLSNFQVDGMAGGNLAQEEIAGSVTCNLVPNSDDRNQRMILRISKELNWEVAMQAEGTRLGSVPQGRGIAKAEIAATLLPPSATFDAAGSP